MSSVASQRLNMLRTSPEGMNVRVVSSFDEPSVSPEIWSRLLARGPTDSVNLTWEWQRNWWSSFGRGRLLLLLVERDSEPICIAPLFVDEDMVFNICPEDQLDFVGDTGPDVMDVLVQTLRQLVPELLGITLYFFHDASTTAFELERAAARAGMICYRETCLAAPRLEIVKHPELAARYARKKSLIRHENFFRRNGHLTVNHTSNPEEIIPQLNEFFNQHIARRNITSHPSIFKKSVQRDYYSKLVTSIGSKGWLRFTRLDWNGRAIAFHFGFSYQKRFLYGIPSFDIELRQHSPGEVLLRHLLLHAIDDGAEVFDFGPGDERYKYRFATSEVQLVTLGVYPKSSSLPRTTR